MDSKKVKRLLIVGIVIFLSSIFLMASASITSQKNRAYHHMEQRLTALASTITTSITSMMITGNAMIVGDWMKGIKQTPGVAIMQVIRKDGVEAFSDDSVIHKVNKQLGVEMFTVRVEGLNSGNKKIEKQLSSAVSAGRIADVVSSQKPLFYSERVGEANLLTMLAPVKAYEDCAGCHGYDSSPVRAIVRISIPTAEVEQSSKEVMKQEALFAGAIGVVMLLIFTGYAVAMLKKLREGQEELMMDAQVFAQSKESIMITDLEGNIKSVNPAFVEVAGYSEEEVLGKNPRFLQSGKHDKAFYHDMWDSLKQHGRWIGEIYNKRKNGETYPEQLSISALRDSSGKVVRYSGIFTDITERKRQEEKIAYMAYHDNLTGLPNRRTFTSLMDLEFTHAKRNGYSVAIMFLDLDGFKQVNDSNGHDVGDALLIKVAEIISKAVREGDTLARIGGDEFTILMPQLQEADHVKKLGNKILSLFKNGVTVGEVQLDVGTSIGIAIYPEHGSTPDEVLRRADEAMYRVKNSGKNSFIVWSPE